MNEKEFTDKVRQVFDNFEDPSAEYGWAELRKKYPEKHTKPMLMWWAAAAAILIIAGGIWLMIPGMQTDPELVGITPRKQLDEKREAVEPPRKTTGAKVAAAAPDERGGNTAAKSPAEEYSPASTRNAPHSGLAQITPVQQEAGAARIPKAVTIAAPSAENSIQNTAIISLPQPFNPATAVHTGAEVTRDSLIETQAKMLALAQPNTRLDPHAHRVEEVSYPSAKTSTSNHAFSFFAGSFFNYSLGSETELNFGAGFTSDIKLSRNVSLSTGVAVANNSLTYNNGVPSAQRDNVQFDMPALGPSNNSLTTITKYDASLLALDIPVNIKYLIIPDANKLYLSAGLSSGTYLSEKYSVNYRNYGVSGAYLNQRQGEEIKKQLQGFDFARTLNISFGYSANLGKAQNITIEPFLKYPLGGLGSEDLKFGATGLNLKLNFSHFKKR